MFKLDCVSSAPKSEVRMTSSVEGGFCPDTENCREWDMEKYFKNKQVKILMIV